MVGPGRGGCGAIRARALRYIPLVVWFCGISALLGALATGHWFALPAPDRGDARLAAGIHELTYGAPSWSVVHVLYTECRCSRRILDHLLASERPTDVQEVIVLVGDEPALAARLRARRYRVTSITPELLTVRFGLEGAPLFVVVDPRRAIRYLGGYTRRQQGADISDLSIIRDLRAGTGTDDLPVFGCAVSQRLKELADPLSIKR
jgi:hypothetical protein